MWFNNKIPSKKDVDDVAWHSKLKSPYNRVYLYHGKPLDLEAPPDEFWTELRQRILKSTDAIAKSGGNISAEELSKYITFVHKDFRLDAIPELKVEPGWYSMSNPAIISSSSSSSSSYVPPNKRLLEIEAFIPGDPVPPEINEIEPIATLLSHEKEAVAKFTAPASASSSSTSALTSSASASAGAGVYTHSPSPALAASSTSFASPNGDIVGYVFELRNAQKTIGDADVEVFKQEFCARYGVPADVILRVEVLMGSEVFRVVTRPDPRLFLCEVDVSFKVNKQEFHLSDFTVNKQEIHMSDFAVNYMAMLAALNARLSIREVSMRKELPLTFSLGAGTEAETVTLSQEYRMLDKFMKQLVKKSRLNVVLRSVAKYDNRKFEDEFFQRVNTAAGDQLVYLCHGSTRVTADEDEHPDRIKYGFETNHKPKDGGYFGKGAYMTSFLDYALFYQFSTFNLSDLMAKVRKMGTFRIMVFLCNLKHCEEVHAADGLTFCRQNLPANVDSRYAKVGQCEPNSPSFFPVQKVPNATLVFDEYVFKERYQVLPSHILTLEVDTRKTFIWRDTHIGNAANTRSWELLEALFKERLDMHGVDSNESAFALIDANMEKKDRIYVASNRAGGGPAFLAQCRARGVTTPAVIYARNTDGLVAGPGVEVGVAWNTLEMFIRTRVLVEKEEPVKKEKPVRKEEPVKKAEPVKKEKPDSCLPVFFYILGVVLLLFLLIFSFV